jgi:type II secretory pathway pseudopilin PulG
MRSGFTLIEILVAFGVVVFLAALTLSFDPLSYQRNMLSGEEDTLITLLQTARMEAMTNVDHVPHGVAFYPYDHPNSYVLFEGSSYATRVVSADDVVDGSSAVTFTITAPSEIVFDQLSGDASYEGSFGVENADGTDTKTISVNHEGQISW